MYVTLGDPHKSITTALFGYRLIHATDDCHAVNSVGRMHVLYNYVLQLSLEFKAN